MEHTAPEEIVIKCPLVNEDLSDYELLNIWKPIIYETQLIKLCPYLRNIAEIKEELIEYNAEKGIITRYCVIVEQAQFTLGDLIKTWCNDE